MDEAPPTTPRTLLWRGTRCLRNDSPTLRPCGLRRLCRLFGIDLAARQRETDLVLSIFAGLAPQHGLDRDLAPLAVLAHTLVELGTGCPMRARFCSPILSSALMPPATGCWPWS